jgi:hypothetical protein
MKVRKSIFRSRSEEKLFTKLQTGWSKKFDLWPSLPYSNIIDIEKTDNFLDEKELGYFYKTDIDYTLCEKRGTPLLSMEFDGLGKGFNRRGEYVQRDDSGDPYRLLNLNSKIELAKKASYPFYVISFEESETLDPNTNLSIVDGIIGQVLSKKEFEKLSRIIYEENRETIELLPSYSRNRYIQDLAWDAETIAELKWDPVGKLVAKLMHEITETGILQGMMIEFLDDREFPDGDPFEDKTFLEKRIEAFKKPERVGCRIIINTPKVAIIETVWLRNIQDDFISPLHMSCNIAQMLAFRKALDLIKVEQ